MNFGVLPINIWVIGSEPRVSKNEVIFANVTDKEMNGLDFPVYHHMGYNFVSYFPNSIKRVIGVPNCDRFAKRGAL